MANSVYPKGKQHMLGAGFDLDTDTIKVALMDSTASYNAAHDFWDDVSGDLVGTAQSLASVTLTDGVFNAANVTFTAVTGNPIIALIIYKDTGVAATSPLLAWIDTTGVGAIAVTPSGGNIIVNWDTGASKIFAL